MAVPGRRRLAAALWLAFLFASLAPPGLSQAPERCVLSGTVLNSVANAGLAHVLVSYSGAAMGFRFTDTGGNFRVEEVPCGFYNLSVSKPGFLSEKDLSPQIGRLFSPPALGIPEANVSEESGSAPAQSFQPVELKAASPPVRIPLVPVSSITGTVLDENDQPLEGLAVQGIAVRASSGGADYVVVRTSRTDDRGHYALLNVLPGEYVVRLAGEVSSTRYFLGSRLNLNNDHRGMEPVYFPNGDSPSSAQVFNLRPGEQANADFRHATEAAFDINGRITNLSPQAWTQIQLYREVDRLPVGLAFVNLSSGQFRVVDVPPGSYTLRAVQYQADPPQWMAVEVPVVIGSKPIHNLVIELSAGADIPVSVSYEAGAKTEGFFSLMLQPQHTTANVRRVSLGNRVRAVTTPSDKTPPPEPETPPAPVFQNVIPDKYRLVAPRANGQDYVASAKLGEMDVLHGEFSIGGAPGELQITVRGDSASVEGQVTSAPQAGFPEVIYLIPSTASGTGVITGFSTPEGKYLISGIPPGDYRIQAWRGTPDAKQILSGSGEAITLQPGEHKTMTLEPAQGSAAGRPPL